MCIFWLSVANSETYYEINYQLDAIEYLFALSSFSSTCFGLTRPSSGAIGVTISKKCSIWCPWILPGKVSVLRSVCAVGVLHCSSSAVAVQHANSTHTPQDRHLTRQKPNCYCSATRQQHTHSSGPTPYQAKTKDTICYICKKL